MAAKPTKIPTWGSDGLNNTEPSGAKKALGWEFGEEPASSFFNWLLKLIGEWAAYLRDGVIVGEVGSNGITSTGGTGSALGVVGIGTGTAAGVAGVGGPTNAPGVTGQGTGLSAAGVKGTGSATGSSAFGGDFTGGAGGAPGVRGTGTGNNPGVKGIGAGNALGGVVGVGSASAMPGGYFARGDGSTVLPAVQSIGSIDFTGATNPAGTAALTKETPHSLMVKAWLLVETDGLGGLTIHQSQNVASAAVNSANKSIDVTLAAGLSTNKAGVHVTPYQHANAFIPAFSWNSATIFSVYTYKHDGTALDPAAYSNLFMISVQGLQ